MVVLSLIGILFLGVLIDFSSVGRCEERKNIIFVGGSGLGNYSIIQDAVNDANDEDTIFVHNGIYYENLFLNKSITIIGENRFNTIIDGSGSGDAVVIYADNVCIRNFTIKNKGASGTGISINADGSIIIYNLITDNGWSGIETGSACNYCTIYDNNIVNNGYGIFFDEKNLGINISNNIAANNSFDGIYLDQSSNSIVSNNVIENNGDDGLSLTYSKDVVVSKNFITNNKDNGIYLYSSIATISESMIRDNVESGIFLRNSNESQIVWNSISKSKKGIEVTFRSCNNIVNNNNFTSNDIGIYSSADAGINDFSYNSFSDNNADVKKDLSKTPGFEIIIALISITLVIFWRLYKK